MGNGTTDPQNEEFSSTDVELARLTKEVLDTLQVPEILNSEFQGIDNLDDKIDEYGRIYRRLYAELFLEEDEEGGEEEEPELPEP